MGHEKGPPCPIRIWLGVKKLRQCPKRLFMVRFPSGRPWVSCWSTTSQTQKASTVWQIGCGTLMSMLRRMLWGSSLGIRWQQLDLMTPSTTVIVAAVFKLINPGQCLTAEDVGNWEYSVIVPSFFLLQNVYDDKIMTRLTLRTNKGFPQQWERRWSQIKDSL